MVLFFLASVPHVLVIQLWNIWSYIFTASGTEAQVSFTDSWVVLAVLWPHFHWKNHDQDQEIIKTTRAEWFRRGRYPKVWYFGLTQRILAEQRRVRKNQLSSCKVGKAFFFWEVRFFVGQIFGISLMFSQDFCTFGVPGFQQSMMDKAKAEAKLEATNKISSWARHR